MESVSYQHFTLKKTEMQVGEPSASTVFFLIFKTVNLPNFTFYWSISFRSFRKTTVSYAVKIFPCYQEYNVHGNVSFENNLFQGYLRIKNVYICVIKGRK